MTYNVLSGMYIPIPLNSCPSGGCNISPVYTDCSTEAVLSLSPGVIDCKFKMLKKADERIA